MEHRHPQEASAQARLQKNTARPIRFAATAAAALKMLQSKGFRHAGVHPYYLSIDCNTRFFDRANITLAHAPRVYRAPEIEQRGPVIQTLKDR